MNDIEFKELVKISVEKLRDDTLYELLKGDIAYQEDSKRESEAESKYMKLDLTQEQRIALPKELLFINYFVKIRIGVTITE